MWFAVYLKVNKSGPFQAERGLRQEIGFPWLNELPCGERLREHTSHMASVRRNGVASASIAEVRIPGPRGAERTRTAGHRSSAAASLLTKPG